MKKKKQVKKPASAKEKKEVPALENKPGDWMGSMKGKIEILGDIISPATDEDEWEVLRD